ncbi:MAG: ATP-binding cassette domain-containing protein, partial [Streptococcus salivarius]
MFQLNQVACAYEQKKVFTGLDLEIRQGQYVMLMGENGTGKSSLISLLTGFKQAESG